MKELRLIKYLFHVLFQEEQLLEDFQLEDLDLQIFLQ